MFRACLNLVRSYSFFFLRSFKKKLFKTPCLVAKSRLENLYPAIRTDVVKMNFLSTLNLTIPHKQTFLALTK